jgi:hypothetical protein
METQPVCVRLLWLTCHTLQKNVATCRMFCNSLFSVVAVMAMMTAATAQEKSDQLSLVAEYAKLRSIDLENLRAMTHVTDGAETPELAIEQFFTAAIAANIEQALALIEPRVRPLIALETRLDHDACHEKMFGVMLEKTFEGKPKMSIIGFSVIFAERDIVGIRKIEILRKRVLDPDRVIFRIKKTARSYHHEGDNKVEQDLMSIRRDNRWYLFFLLGHMNWVFRDTGEAPETLEDTQNNSERPKPILDVQNDWKPNSGPDDTDFIEVLSVPIEEIHAELAKQAAAPAIQECEKILRDRQMLQRNLVSRLARDDFETFAEWETAKQPCDEQFEVVARVMCRLFSTAKENLAKAQLDQE